jgi:hypothetical protein
MVLIVLADHANAQGQCWPSRETIAEEACLGSLNTVDAHLEVLEAAGFLIKEQRKTAAGRPTTFMFSLNLDFEMLDKHLQRNRKTLQPAAGVMCNSCTSEEGGAGATEISGQTAHRDVQELHNTSCAETAHEPSKVNHPPQPPKGERGVLASQNSETKDPDTEARVERFLAAYPVDPSDRVAGERAFRKLSATDQEAALRWAGTYLADCRAKGRKLKSPQAYVRDRVFEGYAASSSTSASSGGRVWIREGSAEWEAWLAYRRKHGGLTVLGTLYATDSTEHRGKGRYEPTRFPPGHVEHHATDPPPQLFAAR